MDFSERSLKFMIVATKDAGRHSRQLLEKCPGKYHRPDRIPCTFLEKEFYRSFRVFIIGYQRALGSEVKREQMRLDDLFLSTCLNSL